MLASIAWGGLGRAMLTMGDWQHAVEYFTAAMKPSAAQALEKAPSLLGLAEAYHRDGVSDEATAALSQASDAIRKSDLAHLYPRLALVGVRIGGDNPEEKLERLRLHGLIRGDGKRRAGGGGAERVFAAFRVSQ